MSDTRGIRLDLQRHAFHDAPLEPITTLREHLREQLEARHVFQGRSAGAARFFGDGYVEVLPLAGVVDVGEESMLARIVVELGGREGILRTFRDGEALVRAPDGGLRRALGLLELTRTDDGERWWLAWRTVGTGPEGAGQWHGEWNYAEGGTDDQEGLPEGFDEWVDTGTSEVKSMEMSKVEPKATSMTGGLTSYSGSAPTDLVDAARILAPQALPEVVRGGVEGLHVFVLSEATLETYCLLTPPPVSRPDLVRALVARAAGHVLAVAVAQPTALDTPEGQKRGIGLLVEHERSRGLLFTEVRSGPDGGVQIAQSGKFIPQGEIDDEAAWIGVAPEQTIDLGVEWTHFPGGVSVEPGEA